MSTIILFSEDRQAHVKIERVAYEGYDLSQQLSVSVLQGSFQGSVDVWVDDSVIRNFVEQLGKCEEFRLGEANLISMSPDEFSLRIFNTHHKGDFALVYEISHYQHRVYLKGEFTLDPSLLLKILREFEDFFIP